MDLLDRWTKAKDCLPPGLVGRWSDTWIIKIFFFALGNIHQACSMSGQDSCSQCSWVIQSANNDNVQFYLKEEWQKWSTWQNQLVVVPLYQGKKGFKISFCPNRRYLSFCPPTCTWNISIHLICKHCHSSMIYAVLVASWSELVDLWVSHSVKQASSSTTSFFRSFGCKQRWMDWFANGVVNRFASRDGWVIAVESSVSCNHQLGQIRQGDFISAIDSTCWHTSTTLVLFLYSWRLKPRFGMNFLTLVGRWNWIYHTSKVWSALY